MLKPSVAAFSLFTLFSTMAGGQVTAETMRDAGFTNLKTACADLGTVDGRKTCQRGFVDVVEAFRVQQSMSSRTPHSVSYGSIDDPIILPAPMVEREAITVTGSVDGNCHNIHFRKKDDTGGRLDDGSRTGMLRIAERAKSCVEIATLAANITQTSQAYALAKHIIHNADKVIPQVNDIADILAAFRPN